MSKKVVVRTKTGAVYFSVPMAEDWEKIVLDSCLANPEVGPFTFEILNSDNTLPQHDFDEQYTLHKLQMKTVMENL